MKLKRGILKMNEQTNQTQFYKVLCNNSNNKDPRLAVLEWKFIYIEEYNNNCICGMPIHYNCLIRNKLNNNELIVGNVCVNKFINNTYEFIVKGIIAVKNDSMPNKSFINYCYGKGYIYENQKDFLLKIFGKKKLSDSQKSFKLKVLYKLKLRSKY